MKKTLALKKSSDFQRILKKGSWHSGEYVSIYIMKNVENNNLLGIAVGKKGLNSVQRNRIKRLIREAYRSIENELEIGYNIVVLWRSKNTFEDATFQNIDDDMKKCFRKFKMLK